MKKELDPRIKELLSGRCIKATLAQLSTLLIYMNEFNINTLSVQKSGKFYYLKVDKHTVAYHTRNKGG